MASPSAGTDAQVRSKIAAKLAEALCSSAASDVDPALARELADEIEHEMSAIKTTKEYTAKGRSLVFNLTKNNELRRRVLQRQIAPAKLVSATAKELAPDQIKLQRAASVDRYVASRQVGATELVVGWQAGTSGKLEWSGQNENSGLGEKSGVASGLEAAPMEFEVHIPHAEPDDTLLDAVIYSPTARQPSSAVRSAFMRTLPRATLLRVGLAEATSDVRDVDLSGEASEDAVRVAEAMVCVREVAEGLS